MIKMRIDIEVFALIVQANHFTANLFFNIRAMGILVRQGVCIDVANWDFQFFLCSLAALAILCPIFEKINKLHIIM